MVDRISAADRKRTMQRIRSKDTGPEMMVRRYLHRHGLRYRLHDRTLPGSPDIVLPRYRTVVQVHGCFWHQHDDPDCRDSRIPDSNRSYWAPKLQRTVVRDRESYSDLRELGWHVEVVWECQIGDPVLAALVERIRLHGP